MMMRNRRNDAEEIEEAVLAPSEESRALSARAEELRAQFAEHVTRQTMTGFAGWTLISTGISWGVTNVMRGKHAFRNLIAPTVLLAMGAAVLGGGAMWHRRAASIDGAEERVRDEMFALDPFARLQVLRDVAEETVPFVKHISLRN